MNESARCGLSIHIGVFTIPAQSADFSQRRQVERNHDVGTWNHPNHAFKIHRFTVTPKVPKGVLTFGDHGCCAKHEEQEARDEEEMSFSQRTHADAYLFADAL